MTQYLTGEQIAYALDSPRKIAPNRFIACCPAHDDKSPSLAITQTSEQILIYCFAGCSQRSVIEALRGRGLWPEEKTAPEAPLIAREDMLTFCLAHEFNLKRDIPTASEHKRRYKQYQRSLCKPFAPGEVVEMDLYCRCYREAVRSGQRTTPDEDSTFILYSDIVYTIGVLPYVW